jgi:hypothetical protein
MLRVLFEIDGASRIGQGAAAAKPGGALAPSGVARAVDAFEAAATAMIRVASHIDLATIVHSSVTVAEARRANARLAPALDVRRELALFHERAAEPKDKTRHEKRLHLLRA